MRRKPGDRRLKAIIWVQDEDRDRLEAECVAHCERHGYQVDSVVVGGEEKWPGIWQALTSGAVDVCVVSSKDPVRDRLPRLEAVTEEMPRIPAQRRTGRVSRWRPN